MSGRCPGGCRLPPPPHPPPPHSCTPRFPPTPHQLLPLHFPRTRSFLLDIETHALKRMWGFDGAQNWIVAPAHYRICGQIPYAKEVAAFNMEVGLWGSYRLRVCMLPLCSRCRRSTHVASGPRQLQAGGSRLAAAAAHPALPAPPPRSAVA